MMNSKESYNCTNYFGVLNEQIKNENFLSEALNLDILHQNDEKTNPLRVDFNYTEAFKNLDLQALKKDLKDLFNDNHERSPAASADYRGLMVKMAWQAAGTYRIEDGRGGAGKENYRFTPINNGIDNTNFETARSLLWFIKKKYGNAISWADLIILAGTMAYESMGLKIFGFAGGREDTWHHEKEINWSTKKEWLTKSRSQETGHSKKRELKNPLAIVAMGFVDSNHQTAADQPNPLKIGQDIHIKSQRMAMNDEETVALIAGGYTFENEKTSLYTELEAKAIHTQGLRWHIHSGKEIGQETITNSPKRSWVTKPTKWENEYFDILLNHVWGAKRSPGGTWQWEPINCKEKDKTSDAHNPHVKRNPIMTDADMAMKMDPKYRKISERFQKDPTYFSEVFAKAWFKLTHRNLGPKHRYLGEDVPAEDLIWQDPIPKVDYLLTDAEIKELKEKLLNCGLSRIELINTAWDSARTFRQSDCKGGANGARIQLYPQRQWLANEPARLQKVLTKLNEFKATLQKNISLADLIVLGGSAAIEKAALEGGVECTVPFHPGRGDAIQEMTDIASFDLLEPSSDAFRNFLKPKQTVKPEVLMIDKSQLLGLTASEMTVLVGGMRVLGTNYGGTKHGVFTNNEGALSNDFFVNLTDMNFTWEQINDNLYHIIDKKSGATKWTATRVDLVFGSNSVLRAYAEMYAQDDNKLTFIHDFIKIWYKIMHLDRFDLVNK
jgi:catalase-peroxidase